MWCQVFPANSKEVLTSLAVANSSLLVWFKQGGPLSLFMSDAVISWRLFDCAVRITRLMEETLPRFSGRSLQPDTNNRCRSQQCDPPSVFSARHVNLCTVTWPALCLHQFFQLYSICVPWCEPQTRYVNPRNWRSCTVYDDMMRLPCDSNTHTRQINLPQPIAKRRRAKYLALVLCEWL